MNLHNVIITVIFLFICNSCTATSISIRTDSIPKTDTVSRHPLDTVFITPSTSEVFSYASLPDSIDFVIFMFFCERQEKKWIIKNCIIRFFDYFPKGKLLFTFSYDRQQKISIIRNAANEKLLESLTNDLMMYISRVTIDVTDEDLDTKMFSVATKIRKIK